MRVLGIIPARGGSKGIPKKNSKLLGGKPLIAYTIEAAKNSKLLLDIIVSSDSDEIIQIAQNFDVKAPFKRPDELATDESPSIFTILHALEYYKSIGIAFDAVCLLQVTTPFRTGKFIDKAINKFEKLKTDSLISVLKLPHQFNPHWVFEEKINGELKISTGECEIITRRQDLPNCFYRDGSIYITKTEVLLKQKSLYGNSINYIKSNINRYVNIDTIEDWKRAEEMLTKL